jgi:hypothetical protein
LDRYSINLKLISLLIILPFLVIRRGGLVLLCFGGAFFATKTQKN